MASPEDNDAAQYLPRSSIGRECRGTLVLDMQKTLAWEEVTMTVPTVGFNSPYLGIIHGRPTWDQRIVLNAPAIVGVKKSPPKGSDG